MKNATFLWRFFCSVKNIESDNRNHICLPILMQDVGCITLPQHISNYALGIVITVAAQPVSKA